MVQDDILKQTDRLEAAQKTIAQFEVDLAGIYSNKEDLQKQ